MYSENEKSTLSFTRPDIVKDLGSENCYVPLWNASHIVI